MPQTQFVSLMMDWIGPGDPIWVVGQVAALEGVLSDGLNEVLMDISSKGCSRSSIPGIVLETYVHLLAMP